MFLFVMIEKRLKDFFRLTLFKKNSGVLAFPKMSLPYSYFRSEGLCLLGFQHGSEKQFWVPSHSRFCLRALTSFENNLRCGFSCFGKKLWEIVGNYAARRHNNILTCF